jgi:quercetin 2,3-dioxygenase
MTAGRGVSHSEESVGRSEVVHGVQLWVAQPESSRHGPAAFEHHAALPQVDLGGATATVLVGELGGERSVARHDSPLVGADIRVRSR